MAGVLTFVYKMSYPFFYIVARMFSNVFRQVGNFSADGGRVQRAEVVVIHVDCNRFVTKNYRHNEEK
jgi:hypothetical protein